ncbi:MAG: hypothetical protein AAF222_05995 [Pseudomonadota bacterium]
MAEDDDIIMTLAPSIGRRVLGAGSLAALGVVLLSLVFEAEGLWSAVFLVVAILVLLAAQRLWTATADRLELTRHELRTGSGRVLTPLENVESVDRGAFAFKPSNGFLVKLTRPAGAGWSPGLWWQRGRLLGVGGVVRGGEARAMAELISAHKDGTLEMIIEARNAPPPD